MRMIGFYGQNHAEEVQRNENLLNWFTDEANFGHLNQYEKNQTLSKIYHQLIRAMRHRVDTDKGVANRLSILSASAARMLREIGKNIEASEDEAKKYYYACLASQETEDFQIQFKKLTVELANYYRFSQDKESATKTQHLLLARALGHAFKLSNSENYDDKIRLAKVTHKHFARAKNLRATKYQLYVQAFELVRDIHNSRDLNEATSNIYRVYSAPPSLQKDPEFAELEKTYNSLVRALRGIRDTTSVEDIEDNLVRSAFELHVQKIIAGDITFTILQRLSKRMSGAATDAITFGATGNPAGLRERFLLDQIAKGEGKTIEFKETALWDIHQNKANSELIMEPVRASAALLNSDGGIVFIGVTDKGEITGLNRDYDALTQKERNPDAFVRKLNNALRAHIGASSLLHIDVTVEQLANFSVCVLEVSKSTSPQWVDKAKYFTRVSNESIQLSGQDLIDCIAHRSE